MSYHYVPHFRPYPYTAPHSPIPFFSPSPSPAFFRVPEGPFCAEHPEQSQKLHRLEKEVDVLKQTVKSMLNFLAGQELSKHDELPVTEESQEVEDIPPQPQPLEQPPKRKRKTRSEGNGDPKRQKFIVQLEQKLAADRANNEKMEERIANLRRELEELRARRIQKEKTNGRFVVPGITEQQPRLEGENGTEENLETST